MASLSWALLLKRSFAVDVLVCPHCGGRRELLAVIEHKPTVRKILEHLGLESEPPAFAAPRGPPLLAGLEASATVVPPGIEADAGRRVVVDLDFVEPAYDELAELQPTNAQLTLPWARRWRPVR